MAEQEGRTGKDYLSRRKGSPMWRLKFQYSTPELRTYATLMWADHARKLGIRIVWRDGRPAEPAEDNGEPSIHLPVRAVEDHSLGTADKDVARELTADFRHLHERILIGWAVARKKSGAVTIFGRPIMAPQTRVDLLDGSTVAATESEIVTINSNGTISTRPNSPSHITVISEDALSPAQKRIFAQGEAERRKALRKDVDSAIIENYIRLNKKNDEDASSVRRTMNEFKIFVDGRELVQCKRVDAEGFVEWMKTKGGKKGTGLASGTIRRNIALLKAAINVELRKTDEPRLTRNIFELTEIDGGDEIHREAWTEEDMAAVRAHIHEFKDDERLMWTWHASTGIRPIEIHGIDHEEVEVAKDRNDIDDTTGQPRIHRTRYVGLEAGEKAYAKRALPIPQAVLDLATKDGKPLLPERIDGPLFTRTVDRLNDAINSKLEIWGIKTKENDKTFYSCRHRVPIRFMQEGVSDEQLTRAISGHNRKIEPHHAYGRRRGYGHRFTMWRLKIEMDKIGY